MERWTAKIMKVINIEKSTERREFINGGFFIMVIIVLCPFFNNINEEEIIIKEGA